jgi:hypothetical protein
VARAQPVATTVASPAPLPPPPPGASVTARVEPAGYRWYGWQIIITDSAGSLLSAIGALTPGGAGIALGVTGGAVAFLGGPIVHWAHGHVGRGFASMFGLRLGLPVAGALLGAGLGAAAGGGRAEPIATGAYIVGGLAALTGVIVDIAALAYDPPVTYVPRARTGVTLGPFARMDGASRSGVWGVQGTW